MSNWEKNIKALRTPVARGLFDGDLWNLDGTLRICLGHALTASTLT